MHNDSRDLLPDLAASFALLRRSVRTASIFGTNSRGMYCVEEPKKSRRCRSSSLQVQRGKCKRESSRGGDDWSRSSGRGKDGEGDVLLGVELIFMRPEIFCDNSHKQLLKLVTSDMIPLS